MSRDDLVPLTAEQEAARDAFRAWSPPPADAAFRARLKQRFADDDFAREPAKITRLERSRAGAWASPVLRWAVAAALAIAAVGGYLANRGPSWTLTEARGAGVAVIDGVPVPMNHVDDLRRRLEPGARVRVPQGSQLVIAAPRQMALQITQGTDVTLPATPGRWFGREARAEIRSGVLRITTGPAFRGARLALITPEARVRVTGTTLAVICEPQGTCVCVLEGAVEVGAREGPMANVVAGRRRFVFNDARPSEEAPMREGEVGALGALRDRIGTGLER